MKTNLFSGFTKSKCFKLATLFLFLLGMNSAFAQTSPSTLEGVVLDSYGTLPGAEIKLKGTEIGTVTDLSGRFSIKNVPSGETTLSITFLGYQTYEKTLNLEAGGSMDLGEITLKQDYSELKEVVVKSTYRPSQARALSIQKKSAAIMNVLAADAIGKLPDRNAAEAVQRIQGVSIERDHGEGRYVSVRGAPLKWNSNLINGNRLPAAVGTSDGLGTGSDRSVPLDIFPSELIQYVQLSKAITPDMEGDAIGGSVNFITRTAPYERTLNVNLAGGYNNQAQDGSYNASVLYGDRFFNDKLGIIISGAAWERNWGTDNYEVGYNADLEDPNQQFSVSQLELRDYLGKRSTLGLNVGAEYNFNDDHKIFFRGISTSFEDDERSREFLFLFNEDAAQIRQRKAIWGTYLSGGEFGGEHQLTEKTSLSWKGATYRTKANLGSTPTPNPDEGAGLLLGIFRQANVGFQGLSPDGYKYLEGDAPQGVAGDPFNNIQPNMANPLSPDQLFIENLLNFEQSSEEQDYIGQLDVEHEASDKLTLKFGGKFRSKTRSEASPLTIFVPGALVGVPDSPFPFLNNYETEAFPSNGGFLTELGENYNDQLVDQVTQDELLNLFRPESIDELNAIRIRQDEKNPSSAASFFEGTENVFAGYAMLTYNINEKLSFIGGFRNEMTSIDYTGNKVILDEDENPSIVVAEGNRTTNAFLPMAHLKYSPEDNINIRAAYTRTFARPSFGSLNPGTTQNDAFQVISRGNPDLKPTFSDNFDLMGEYFFDNVGVLSGGVFYKRITDDIFNSTSQQNINGLLYTITEPRNLENGYLVGFEAGLSKRLDFLPGVLSGFGVDVNYTYTDSEVDVPVFNVNGAGTIEKSILKQPLPNQSQHLYNASLFYEKYGILARIAANYKGKNVVGFSEFGPEHNRWYDENLTIDFSAAYAFNNKVRVFLELNNLTNEPLRYFHGNVNRPEQVEYYSLRGQLGISYQLF